MRSIGDPALPSTSLGEGEQRERHPPHQSLPSDARKWLWNGHFGDLTVEPAEGRGWWCEF